MVTRFAHATAFREQAMAFLSAHEAEHNLLLGLSALLVVQPHYYGPEPAYFAVVEHDNAVIAVALMTPPHNLTLSRTATPEALALLAHDLHTDHARLPGVVGPRDATAQFAAHWQELSGQSYRVEVAERIYQLDAVAPVPEVSGKLRPINEGDRALLKAWMAAFQQEAHGGAMADVSDDLIDRRYFGDDRAVRGGYLWDDDGPVTLVGYSGPTPNGIRIGPVYTPSEHRRRGYASACVAAVSQRLLDDGRRFCFLYTDLSNPTSNHIYQQIGYQPVSDVDAYVFE